MCSPSRREGKARNRYKDSSDDPEEEVDDDDEVVDPDDVLDEMRDVRWERFVSQTSTMVCAVLRWTAEAC